MTQASAIATALANQIEYVAASLLGNPTSSSEREMRWGAKGSLWIGLSGDKRGRWFDFERGRGGDALDLIADVRGVSLREAKRIAETEFPGTNSVFRACAKRSHLPHWLGDGAQRTEVALRLWRETNPLLGTLGETYFNKHRSIDISKLGGIAQVLRWHPASNAVIALMSDPVTNEAVGVHRTFLHSDCTKMSRKMLGRVGVIRLSEDADVTTSLGLCEGVEDGLAVLCSGWAPVWAAGSAGGIRRFPVLDGIEALTIFADGDKTGLDAARECQQRWLAADKEAVVQ